MAGTGGGPGKGGRERGRSLGKGVVMELGVGRLESGDEAVRCVGTDGKQMGHFFSSSS